MRGVYSGRVPGAGMTGSPALGKGVPFPVSDRCAVETGSPSPPSPRPRTRASPAPATVITALAPPRTIRKRRRSIRRTDAGSLSRRIACVRWKAQASSTPQPRKTETTHGMERAGLTSEPPMARLMVMRGRPRRAPITKPEGRSGRLPRQTKKVKKAAPARAPRARKARRAEAFSAVFAVPATSRPMSSSPEIMLSIPKVTSGPGSTRVTQSKRSNGT